MAAAGTLIGLASRASRPLSRMRHPIVGSGAPSRASQLCISGRPASSNPEGGDGARGDAHPGKVAAMSLCQVNIHPDFRLQLARAKVAARQMGGKDNNNPTAAGNKRNSTVQISENPVRSNDGTSSGALAADRLRMARRRAMEGMGKVPPPAPLPPKWQRERAKRHGSKFHNTVKEHGLGIAVAENPVVSNDGTSSGALAADRLRMARRKAIQSLATPDPAAPTAMQEPEQAESRAARRMTNNAPVKETGLDIVSYENRERSSDGTSSGAKAADRLREARRKALESMKKPASESVSDDE